MTTIDLVNFRLDAYLKCNKNIENINKLYNEFTNNPIDDCFILGTGPTINDLDFDKLKNKFTITVNEFCYGLEIKYPELEFHPNIVCFTNSYLLERMYTDKFDFILNSKYSANNIIILNDGADSFYKSQDMDKYITQLKAYNNFFKDKNIFIVEDIDKFILTKILRNFKHTDDILNYRNKYNHIIQLMAINVANFIGVKNIFFSGCDFPVKYEHFYDQNIDTQNNETFEKNVNSLQNKQEYIDKNTNAYSYRIEQYKHITFYNLNNLHNLPMINLINNI